MKGMIPNLIPLFVPILLAFLKPLVAKWVTERKWWIPLAAPFLGAGLDALSYYLGTGSVGASSAAILGAAGVGVREIYDQLKGTLPNAA